MYVGKYKLVKTIGKGNFAKVKLARHMPTGQEVRKERALKRGERQGGCGSGQGRGEGGGRGGRGKWRKRGQAEGT